MTTHELKTWPEFYSLIESGEKTFELREDNRGFRAGDYLRLREWLPKAKQYTGRETTVLVTYVLSGWGLTKNYVAMSIRRLDNPQRAIGALPPAKEQAQGEGGGQ